MLKTRPRTAGFGAASAHSSPTSEGCLQDSINGAGNGPGRGKVNQCLVVYLIDS